MDLPETEILRRQVQARTVGHAVVDAVGLDTDWLNRSITDVSRHGRVLVVHAADRRLYLSMRGTAGLRQGAHWRGSLRLDLGEAGVFVYQAGREGQVLTGAADDATGRLAVGTGIEPLSSRFSLGVFKRILEKQKRRVKFALSQDSLFAGLGWLYPDEMLHLAGIRPDREIPSLNDDEKRDLYFAIFQTLHKAIRFGGLPGNGATLEGKAGGFERFAVVVHRSGQVCRACGSRVRQVALGRRSSFFCPRCQH